jgi:hypothetical protein
MPTGVLGKISPSEAEGGGEEGEMEGESEGIHSDERDGRTTSPSESSRGSKKKSRSVA